MSWIRYIQSCIFFWELILHSKGPGHPVTCDRLPTLKSTKFENWLLAFLVGIKSKRFLYGTQYFFFYLKSNSLLNFPVRYQASMYIFFFPEWSLTGWTEASDIVFETGRSSGFDICSLAALAMLVQWACDAPSTLRQVDELIPSPLLQF